MNLNFINSAFFFLIFLLFPACNNNSIFHQIIKIENNKWMYSQRLNYKWSVKDTSDSYSITLKIVHDPNLEYRNVYVKCLTSFPDSSKKEQVLSLELFNESGKPFGHCSSASCNTEITLISKTKFQFQGEYGLSIEQYGRDSMVKGLQSFELDIEKIKTAN